MSFVIKPVWGKEDIDPKIYEIGWVNPDGDFETVKHTQHLWEAAILCNYLNGGILPKDEVAIEHVADWVRGIKAHRHHHRFDEE
jgi:hypothetical protein